MKLSNESKIMLTIIYGITLFFILAMIQIMADYKYEPTIKEICEKNNGAYVLLTSNGETCLYER